MGRSDHKALEDGKGGASIALNQSTFSLWETDEELAVTLPAGDASHETEIVLEKKTSRDRFGLILNKIGQRLFVVCATTDQLAAKNGVTFGDEILSINGNPVADMTARQCAEGILRVPQVVLRIAKQPHVRNVTISRQKLNGKREKIGCRVRKDHIVKIKSGSPAERVNVTVGLAVVGVNHRTTIGLEGQAVKRIMKEEQDDFTLRLMDPVAFSVLMNAIPRKQLARLMFSY